MTKEERNEIALQNYGLIMKVLNDYWKEASLRCKGYGQYEDFRQDGFIVLLRAVELYKPEIAKFSSYAYKSLWLRITSVIKRGGFIRTPDYRQVGSNREDAIRARFVNFIDTFSENEEDFSLDSIPSKENNNEWEDTKELISTILDELPLRHKNIIERYYGINKGKRENFRDIAKTLGVTHQRIEQIVKNSLRKLKVKLQKRGIY